jgi:hypothetical protein
MHKTANAINIAKCALFIADAPVGTYPGRAASIAGSGGPAGDRSYEQAKPDAGEHVGGVMDPQIGPGQRHRAGDRIYRGIRKAIRQNPGGGERACSMSGWKGPLGARSHERGQAVKEGPAASDHQFRDRVRYFNGNNRASEPEIKRAAMGVERCPDCPGHEPDCAVLSKRRKRDDGTLERRPVAACSHQPKQREVYRPQFLHERPVLHSLQ